MKLTLASTSARQVKAKSEAAESLVQEFVNRSARLTPIETVIYGAEDALLAATGRQSSRTTPILILFDPRGDALTSEEFAAYLARLRDNGAQRIIFAIGPANGWTPSALARATRTLSLGPMTLPHELARAVVAEQIYRALTILAGHPYHCGH